MRAALLLVSLVCATSAYAVTAAVMSAENMRAAFFGATLDGEYADGLAWSERFDREGRSVYAQQGAQAVGRIVFRANVICFRYDRGFSGGCFEVWRRSANCFDFYGVDSVDAAHASLRQRRAGTGWTARAWRTDAPSTCVSDALS